MSNWSAADISDYDQALAGADAELDRLVTAFQIGSGEVGEHQALANIGVLLAVRDDKRGLLGLLTAALRRLAAEEAT